MMAIWKNTYRPDDVRTETAVWMRYLGAYDYREVNAGLDAFAASETKGFPPSPGQLIDKIHSTRNAGELTATEAWSLVSKAIRRSGYNSAEEFGKLPPAAQKAVGSPHQLYAWAMDETYSEGVAMSQFVRAYNQVVEREHELQKMPESVKSLIRKAEAEKIEGEKVKQIAG